MQTLVGIMTNGAKQRDRIAAAQYLLDRGWGKPVQALSGPDGEKLPTEVLIRVVQADGSSGS